MLIKLIKRFLLQRRSDCWTITTLRECGRWTSNDYRRPLWRHPWRRKRMTSWPWLRRGQHTNPIHENAFLILTQWTLNVGGGVTKSENHTIVMETSLFSMNIGWAIDCSQTVRGPGSIRTKKAENRAIRAGIIEDQNGGLTEVSRGEEKRKMSQPGSERTLRIIKCLNDGAGEWS